MKTYQEYLTEVTRQGIAKAITKRAARAHADDQLRSQAAAGRKAAGGETGKVVNKVGEVANTAQDVKDVAKGGKLAGKHATKAIAKRAPQTAAKVANAAAPVKNVLNKASNVASKVTKPVGKVLGHKAVGPTAVGVGIADATFRNKENQKRYADYSPKKLFGVGPGKTKNVYKQSKPSEGAYAKELGGAAKKVSQVLKSKPIRGRSGASRA